MNASRTVASPAVSGALLAACFQRRFAAVEFVWFHSHFDDAANIPVGLLWNETTVVFYADGQEVLVLPAGCLQQPIGLDFDRETMPGTSTQTCVRSFVGVCMFSIVVVVAQNTQRR